MIQYDTPYTYENSSDPWLMDKKDDSDVLEFNGHKYTAKYLWSLNIQERNQALRNVFNYYRETGFPYLKLTHDKIDEEFEKLGQYDENNVVNKDGYISNSGNLGVDLCKYFCKDYFYKASNGNKSVEDVFYDDDLFIKVLKNRMGWNTTKEGGKERPYIFPVSDKQILNGIRNSGLGYGISNFRPVIAKWMYSYAKELIYKLYGFEIIDPYIFDYSGGWGARMIGALSDLRCHYDCTDPLTYPCLNYIKDSLIYCWQQTVNVYDKCSQDYFFRQEQFKEKYDIIGSCPPYFDQEIYSKNKNQSIEEFKNYQDWLSNYWEETVKNCYYMLNNQSIFILVMKEIVGKHEILNDMHNIIINNGFELVEDRQYKSNTNHLSGKTKSGRTTKNNEHILFYKKI